MYYQMVYSCGSQTLGSQMKIIFLIFTLMSIAVMANPKVKEFDLEANMKNMGLEFKKAVKAPNKAVLTEQLFKLKKLIRLSKTAKFTDGKKKISLEGLNKVIKQIELSEQQNSKGQFNQAKETLMRVDDLRKEYHEHHKPPSIWNLVFSF
ncbi:hypothetical protein CJF42_01110 [Pseudoalteromonas sp. NBT06-2]|nr:hypothetical protein CJF42_01110 [Pseudoalteromonas sp. NBT06-2]